MTLFEAIALGAIGTLALWKALRHLAPAVIVGMQRRVAAVLARPSAPALLRRYGEWLRPPVVAKPSAGCGSGCDACSGCASGASTAAGAFRRLDPPVPRR